MAEPTIYVVDDNPGVRKSLRALGHAAGLAVETYGSAKEFLDAYDPKQPGCLLLDVRLREGSGLDLQDELRRRGVALPIIIMTGYGDVPTSVRALKGGAIDFLQKPLRPKEFLVRVRESLEMDRQARAVAAKRAVVAARIASLTPREREVMEMLALGRSSKEIADALTISVRTVEGHRRVVLRKMEVASVAHLVRAKAELDGA